MEKRLYKEAGNNYVEKNYSLERSSSPKCYEIFIHLAVFVHQYLENLEKY